MNVELWAIIIGAILLLCALVAVSCAKVSGQCSDQERQDELFQIVYQKGYDAGYLAGDRDGYHAGIRRMLVMRKERVDTSPVAAGWPELKRGPIDGAYQINGRVDTAPGFDSIRTEVTK